jgi:TATA-box binding protein (TBP) (component of TFIID and TFIIIB)
MEDTLNYIRELKRIRSDILKNNGDPSWIRITTITITSKILDFVFDTQKFKENFRKIGKVLIRHEGTNFSGFEWSMSETSFYNQVTVSYRDKYSNKSVKIFPNGSVQAAGCSNLMDCHRVIAMLAEVIRVVFNLESKPTLAPPTVQMINTNFSLNSSVHLVKIIRKFSTNSNFFVTFDPEKYSAVKIKFQPGKDMKKVTCSIFSTGKVIVTGARTLKEIVAAYDIINKYITDQEMVQKTDKRESFDTFMGIKFDDWV